MKKALPLLPPLLLFLATFALFAPSVGYRLVSLDDAAFIYNNPIVFNGFSWSALGRTFTALHGDRMMYNPLLWISYLLDNLVFGASPYSPWGYHFTNVLLHAANALLLYFILLTAVRRPWISFFAAAFWAFHPLRVESVAWITERKDTLSTLFAFSSILCYLKAWWGGRPARDGAEGITSSSLAKPSHGLVAASFLFFFLGLLSKPMLVTLPFLFLLLDYWPLRRFSLRNAPRAIPCLLLVKWPFFLLVLLFSIITYRLQTAAITDLPLSVRLLRLPVNYLFYVAKTLWPVNLCPLAPGFPATPLRIVFACVFFLSLAVAGALVFKRAPGILVGLLAFAGLLAPVSGIVFIGGVPVADRYSYLPTLGLSLALLSLLVAVGRHLRPSRLCIVHSALCIVLAALAAVSLHILPSWEDAESFARRAGEIVPGHQISQLYRFTDAFNIRGDLPAAAAAAEAAAAGSFAPSDPFPTLAKIYVLSQTNSSAAAIAFFEQHPIDNSSRDSSLYSLPVALAVFYADVGDFDKANEFIEAPLSNPNSLPILADTLASVAFWLYAVQGMDDRAAELALRIPSMDSSDLRAPGNFLVPYTAMWNMGLRRQALPRLLALADEAPSNLSLQNNIAWLLATAPNSPAPSADVLTIARRAHALAPDHPIVRDTLAVALAFAGQYDEALALDSEVADFLRTASFPGAKDMLANVEKRISLFRSRIPFTENADFKLLFSP